MLCFDVCKISLLPLTRLLLFRLLLGVVAGSLVRECALLLLLLRRVAVQNLGV
jgi:hypothetical protein